MSTNVAELGELTILNDLRERLAAISPEEMAGFERKLLKPAPNNGSLAVGNVRSETARHIFVLCAMMTADSGLESMRGNAAWNPDLEREHKEKAELLLTLSATYKEIFWAQVRMDLAIHRHSHLSVYADWVVLEQPCACQRGGKGIIEFLLGGAPPPPQS